MINIGIVGSTGRVGSLLIHSLFSNTQAKLACVHVFGELTQNLPEHTFVTNDFATVIEKCDVIIDFSVPEATQALLESTLKHLKPKPIVIATTGLSKQQHDLIDKASKKVAILYATNMSLGVAVLNKLVALAAKTLQDFDIEIVEQHHRYKIDAPSGTALTLAKSAADARNLDLQSVRVSARDGIEGPRSKETIAVMALRGGDIVGRHTVGFYNDGEFLELNHTATSRETFSKGAIKAALWIIDQEPALYSINDCLGF